MNAPDSRTPARARRGFTLAEVMIALGIVAFVMMGLMGMLAVGTRSVQSSTNLLLYGKIAEQLVNDLQQTEWDKFSTEFPPGTQFYYDYQGFPIQPEEQSSASGGNAQAKDSEQNFVAKINYDPEEIVEAAKNRYDFKLVRRVTIDVEYTPGGKKPTWELKPKNGEVRMKRHIYLITNQGKLSKTNMTETLNQRD